MDELERYNINLINIFLKICVFVYYKNEIMSIWFVEYKV